MNFKKSNPTAVFVITAALFALCAVTGMFCAFKLSGENLGKTAEFIKSSLAENSGFKAVFLRAVKTDFNFTAINLFCTLGIFTAYFPAVLTFFKGFCSGFCIGIAAKAFESAVLVKILIAVLLSCIFTVPAYILMFMLCLHRAKQYSNTPSPAGEKAKNYFAFALTCAVIFAFLCLGNCILAAVSPILL